MPARIHWGAYSAPPRYSWIKGTEEQEWRGRESGVWEMGEEEKRVKERGEESAGGKGRAWERGRRPLDPPLVGFCIAHCHRSVAFAVL